ncbi:MAG: 2-hydroxyglutaryl-CoA dehydratase [Chloroflexi bacterium]|nr:2-hydroxyglutaryl-CoA dehydratase [Chloroflexota bacterium]
MVKVLEEQEIEAKAREYEQKLRAEMGLDSDAPTQYLRPEELRFTKDQIPSTTILFGGLTLAHEELVREAMRGLGYRVQNLPTPDNAALTLGKELGSRGQCNPTYYTVGNLVKYLIELRDSGEVGIEENYVFITAGGCGPCRFGMYEAEFRKALRDAGFDRFRVLLFEQRGGIGQGEEEDAVDVNLKFGIAFLKAVMVGDMINDVGYKIRPYEINVGDTDRVLEEAKSMLGDTLRAGKSVYWTLRKVRKMFDGIEVDYSRVKPKVKITGEFWAQTTEGDGNYNMFRWLESEGAEVMVEPIGTWVEYLIWIARQDAQERDHAVGVSKRFYKKLELIKIAFRSWYNLYRMGLGFKSDPLPDQDKLAEYAEVYYDTHLRGGEGHLEIGKNVMATKEGHAHMVISLKPFGCMPSTMSDGVQSRVVSDFKNAIFLPIETSGDGEVNVKSRVQMKLYEAKMKAREEVSTILEEKGITVEAVRDYTSRKKKYRHAMRRYGDEHGISTAANFLATVGGKMD